MTGTGRKDSLVEAVAKSAARTVGSTVGREIVRGVLGSLLGKLRLVLTRPDADDKSALRPATRIRYFLCSATESHGTVQGSIDRDTAMADVVPSEELRSLLLRLYSVLEAQDVEALREMFSTGAHALVIGTDPNEWWTGSDGLDVWIVQIREAGGFRFEASRPTAYCSGNVGWVADEPLVTIGNGVQCRVRVTGVMVIERGHWRIAQWHVSIAQTNEESFGMAFTTSIDRIERSVRDDRPDVGKASAPDGTVTIAFSDIESSTVLLERLGDAEFLRMLGWHDRIVRDTAEEYRGFVVKSQGDGFMLAFPSASFALRASLVMRDRIAEGFAGLPVRIRAGLHSGEAIKHDDDFYGRTVAIAARISALALGGEVLASDLVYALARGLGTFTFGAPRTAQLKGLEGSFDLHPVLA